MYRFFKSLVECIEKSGDITEAVFRGDHFDIALKGTNGKKITIWVNTEKETENNGN